MTPISFIIAERTEPQGEHPACGVDDHRWRLRVECGSVSIECVDPCSIETIEAMKYGAVPACCWVPDEAVDMVCFEAPVKVIYDRGPRDWESGVYDDPSMTIEIVGDPT